jgi:hypothetical protein
LLLLTLSSTQGTHNWRKHNSKILAATTELIRVRIPEFAKQFVKVC